MASKENFEAPENIKTLKDYFNHWKFNWILSILALIISFCCSLFLEKLRMMRKKVGNPPLRMMMTTSIKRATVAFRDEFRAQAIKNAKKM